MSFPAVDPLRSSSRLLTPEIVGEEHYETAREVRDLLARYPATSEAPGAGIPALDDVLAWRARQVRRFLGQPMFMAADFTKLPGQAVPLAETIRGCRAILRGECDGLPLEAFWMVGTIAEAREKAMKLAGK
jgi:F-type H+-transporting ATPase subunit beta